MPIFNITLEDTSPLLRYSTNWRAGTSADDSSADQYSESSFSLTAQQGETMEFDFYGTSLTLFGSKRGNHGVYQGQLDGGSVFSGNGSASTFAFKQPLYTASSTLGSHSMVITNQQNTFFDVDYVIFQTSVGRDDEDLIVNSFEDDHPSFVYTPASAWYTTTDTVGWFSGSTGHFTNQTSAVAQFNFQGKFSIKLCSRLANALRSIGDAVALYGAVGSGGAEYSVQVDKNNSQIYNAKKSFFRPKEVLFYAGNLGSGNHSLQVQINSAALAELSIDYATVYTTSSLGGSFLGVTPPSIDIITGHEAKTPTGIIAALAVTSALALISTLAFIFIFWRQRRERSSLKAIPVPPMGHNLTQAPPVSVLPSTQFPSPTTTTGLSYTSPSVPSTVGPSSSVSSGGAVAASSSGYMPQGKRNAAMLAMSDANDGVYPGERRITREINPPQYSVG